MPQFDPKLFAMGIGALSGGYALSSNNDPIAMAAGAAIGATVGSMGNFTAPDINAMLSATNSILPMPRADKSSMLERERASLRALGKSLVTNGTNSFDGAFDSAQPFSTLSAKSLDGFHQTVNTLNDVGAIRRMALALNQQTDSVGLNLNDIKAPVTADTMSIRLEENASAADKKLAFQKYASEVLGYGNNQKGINLAYARIKPLLDQKGTIHFTDGAMKIQGMHEAIPLSSVIGSGDNAIRGYVRGGNVYNTPGINLFGNERAAGKKVDAIATALGLKMTEAFDKQMYGDLAEQMAAGSTAGSTIEDAIAMAARGGASKEGLDAMVADLKKLQQFNANATGQLALQKNKNLGAIVNTDHSRNIDSRTTFTRALNLTGGKLDLDRPSRAVSSYSTGNNTSEASKIDAEIRSAAGFDTRANIKPDKSLEFGTKTTGKGLVNKLGKAATYKRNQVTAMASIAGNMGSRSHDVANAIDNGFDGIVKRLGVESQYGSSVAIQKLTTDMDQFNPLIAAISGRSDAGMGDGFAIGNRAVTRNISITEGLRVDLLPDENGFVVATNPVVRKMLEDPDFDLGAEKTRLQSLVQANGFDNLSTEDRAHWDGIYARAGSVVGHDAQANPIEVGKQFSRYELMGLDHVKDGEFTKIQQNYQATTNIGEQGVSKFFGPADKYQVTHSQAYSTLFKQQALAADLINRGDLSIDGKGKVKLFNADVSLDEVTKAFTPNANGSIGASLQEMLQTKSVATGSNFIADIDSRVDTFSRNVGIITDVKDAGHAPIHDVVHDLQSGKSTSKINSGIMDIIKGHYNASANKSPELAEALGRLALSASEAKASSSVVLDALMTQRNIIDGMVKDKTTSIADVNAHLASLGYNKPIASMSNFRKSHKRIFADLEQSLVKIYKEPAMLAEALRGQNDELLKRLPFFSKNTSYAYASAEVNAEGVLGSGSTGKSMSWNSQLQLKYSGFSNTELNLFGKHDAGKLSDYHSILSIGKTSNFGINDQVTAKNLEAVKRAIATSSDRRREALKEAGVDVKGPYGMYNLNYAKNAEKIAAIPIPLETTSLFSTYVSKKTGQETNPRVIGLISSIMEHDARYASAKTVAEKDAAASKLDALTKEYSGLITKHITSEDPLQKTVLSRNAPRSVYSNVNVVDGKPTAAIKALEDAGKSAAYGVVSTGGALQRLREAGFDVKDEAHMKRDFVEKVDLGNGESFTRLKTNKGTPFFSITTREPSTGPGSTHMRQYMLDETIDKENLSMHLSSQDKLFKHLQLGDYDGDHVAEFFPDFKKDKAVKSVFTKLETNSVELSKLTKYAGMLGIKGKDKAIPSMLDVLDPAKAMSTEEMVGAYTDSLFAKSAQTGTGKRIAPLATEIATGINNSLAHMELPTAEAARARILSHYLVENLIKTKHMDSKAFQSSGAKTDIEKLHSMRATFKAEGDTTGQYLGALRSHLTSMADMTNMTPEDKKSHLAAVEHIVSAENVHATAAPINTINAGVRVNATLRENLDILNEVAVGKNAYTSILDTVEDAATPIADRTKLGYDMLNKSVMKNISENKMVLGAGLGALAFTALMTQRAPDFSRTDARADPSKMMLAAASDHSGDSEENVREHVKGFDMSQATSHILPEGHQRMAANITGGYVGQGNFHHNVQSAIFGDNVNTVRVENY